MLSKVCSEVIYAQHYPYDGTDQFPGNLRLVADVKELTEEGVLLLDGEKYAVDAIIYCTGFYYSYPFLTIESGVHVDENCVEPLFKQVININYPTMAFIGLNYHLCIQLVIDLQARFCVKLWTTNRQLPEKKDMLEESKRDLELRLAKGWKKRHAHRLWDLHDEYNRDLAKFADIPGIKPVHLKIFFESMGELRRNYLTCRNAKYQIIDNDNYVKIEGEVD